LRRVAEPCAELARERLRDRGGNAALPPRPASAAVIPLRSCCIGSSRPTMTGVDRYACETRIGSTCRMSAIAVRRCMTSNAVRGRMAGSSARSDMTRESSASGTSACTTEGAGGALFHNSASCAKDRAG